MRGSSATPGGVRRFAAVSAPSPARLAGGVGAAVLAVSSAALFILFAAPLEPLVIAVGRMTITGTALAVLGVRFLRPFLGTIVRDRDVALRVGLAAALLALHFGTWIASLSMTTVLRSVALVATQPLFAGLLGRLIGDRASPRLYAGAVVALLGSVVMGLPATGATTDGSTALLGDLLAVTGAAAAAAYLIVGRSVRTRVPLGGYLSAVHLLGAAMLGLVAFVTDVTWMSESARAADWLAVVYLGLVPGLIGHGLFNWAVRHAPVHSVSLTALLEPVGAAALAWLVLGRTVGMIEGSGAALLLVGVVIGLPRRNSNE